MYYKNEVVFVWPGAGHAQIARGQTDLTRCYNRSHYGKRN